MIKRKINKTATSILFYLIVLNTLSAQIVSPFNNLKIIDTSQNYSFIVSGHFHGASNNISTFPSSTLLANIDTLNSLKPSFLMSLGDMFLDVNETYIEHYQKSLFDKLKMPLLNAVGNHDLSNNNMYEEVYGTTFFTFKKNTELFVVLNTEINDGSIQGNQLKMLKTSLSEAKNNNIKNIFIFSHRPVWAEDNAKYSDLFIGNTRSSFGSPNFEKEIHPLLKKSAIPIYWISGSMADAPAAFFYDKNETSNITFMQTAIRDLPRDAILQVNIIDGKIYFKGISLTGQILEPIENYNINYWTKNSAPEKSFNYRLLPYLTLQMFKNYFFWIGFIFCCFFILLLRYIMKQWKEKK